MMTLLEDARIAAAKPSFAVRNVPLSALRALDDRPRKPQAGDIVLVRVVEVGRLKNVQLPSGRKSQLYPGDELVLVYGHRYAPDAYEAKLPDDLGPCELAAAGGLAGQVEATNFTFADEKSPPTRLQPVGLFVGSDGKPLNVSDFAVADAPLQRRRTPVICVFGASMNAGKTTTAAGLIKGLTAQGVRVGAAKVTGTCSGGDLFKFQDAGAVRAIDFTDAGLATTYRACTKRVVDAAESLVADLDAQGCEVIVMEIADGLFQKETAALLRDDRFRSLVDHWMFAADSAPSILTGLKSAESLGIEIAAVSGSVTASPLAVREAMAFVDAAILTLPDLCEGQAAKSWLDNPGVSFRGLTDVVLTPEPTEALAS